MRAVLYGFSFPLNTMLIRVLGLSLTCCVRSGVGTVFTAAMGIFYFTESATAVKMVRIGFIVLHVMGLQSASRVGA